jgi:hypothetical protein
MAAKNQCAAVYGGTSAARGGRCRLEAGHDGRHQTHGIVVGPSGSGPVQDGSQGFFFVDSERSDLRDQHVEREIKTGARQDPTVNHPAHYAPGGNMTFEAINVIDAWGLGFALGNCVKYVCRAGRKTPSALTDLRKALWYLQHEIKRLEDET